MTNPPSSPPPSRDWDKELAEIDRLMAKPPAPAAASAGPAVRPAGSVVAPSKATGKMALATWARVLLGVAIGAGMTQWPYAHSCGFQLALYLGATGGVVLAGLWGMITSWKRRMPIAHTVSLAVALWGGYLAGREILDRTGYAKVTKAWFCSSAPQAGSQ